MDPYHCATLGRAGEHLVCFDLLMQGHRPTLTEGGLPYDLIVDVGDRVLRVQVKTKTTAVRDVGKTRMVYRFRFHQGKKPKRYQANVVDVFAFAFLDVLKVTYLPASEALTPNGLVKQVIDWRHKSDMLTNDRSKYKRNLRHKQRVKHIEDYEEFRW